MVYCTFDARSTGDYRGCGPVIVTIDGDELRWTYNPHETEYDHDDPRVTKYEALVGDSMNPPIALLDEHYPAHLHAMASGGEIVVECGSRLADRLAALEECK
jgi:hypothetical protein